MTDFKRRHFQGDVILWAVRWYCRYPISYRDLEEMLAERGISVDHTTIYRWVQCYARRWRSGCAGSGGVALIRAGAWMKPTSRCGSKWTYLHRAVDKRGDTIDFYLSPTRSAKAAKRFRARPCEARSTGKRPTLNTDKAPSYGAAITELKREGKLDRGDGPPAGEVFNNNVIEADHGKLKIPGLPARGFKSIPTAYATIKGFEVMRALRKDRLAPGACSPASGRGAPCGESFGIGPSALTEAMGMLNHHFAAAA